MPDSSELTLLRSRENSFFRQVIALARTCQVELVALAAAITLTGLLGRGLKTEMRDWDANGVALLIAALWMAICVVLYRFLVRTSR
jgi:hypothetical protein